MRRRVPDAPVHPPRLVRYDPSEWAGPQCWYDARLAWAEANPDVEALGIEGSWPDVPWDPVLDPP